MDAELPDGDPAPAVARWAGPRLRKLIDQTNAPVPAELRGILATRLYQAEREALKAARHELLNEGPPPDAKLEAAPTPRRCSLSSLFDQYADSNGIALQTRAD